MYDYIYWVMYQFDLKRGKGIGLARMDAGMIVFLAFFVHLTLIVSIFLKLGEVGFMDRKYKIPNGLIVVLFFLCLIGVNKFYNQRRVDLLNERFSKNERVAKWKGILIVAALIIIPMIILGILRWKG